MSKLKLFTTTSIFALLLASFDSACAVPTWEDEVTPPNHTVASISALAVPEIDRLRKLLAIRQNVLSAAHNRVDEVERTNRELDAANRELDAANRKLGAANQKLGAANQKLGAANQKFISEYRIASYIMISAAGIMWSYVCWEFLQP